MTKIRKRIADRSRVCGTFGIWDLGFASDFGFRISDFPDRISDFPRA